MAVRFQTPAAFWSACLGLLLSTVVACQRAPQQGVSDAFSAEPQHQVVARYFHRTQRCPTCQKISALIEEAVQAGFADDLKSGKVKLQMVDYQDARNREVTETYKISDPMLVILDVHDGKVAEWKLAPKVWALFIKKDAFTKYVQDEMHAYLDGKPAAQ
jgi:thiol-disulfide isomerase/thioredoxin